MNSKQINNIWHAVKNLYKTGNHPQISFCLRRRGQIVLNRSLGHAQGNGPSDALNVEKKLAKNTTPICLFSASKVITAMLVHILNEEGLLNLLDPISQFIPEYAKHGKHQTTIFHLLSHRGGIPRIDGKFEPELLFNKKEVLQQLYATKPISASGSKLAYHAITAGYILGEVLERASGKSLQDLMDEKISKPMDMRHFNYGLAPEFRDEVALNYSTGFHAKLGADQYLKHLLGADLNTAVRITNDSRFMDTISPAANIYTSAEEVCRFFEMLLNGGKYQDKQIMSPESVFRATLPISGNIFDHSILVPMRYSLGPILGNNPIGLYGPMTSEAFGHIGFTNIFCWADPQRDISVSLLTTGKSVLGTHLPALANVLYQISNQCPTIKRTNRRALFGSNL
ncbi:MAG: serine hydrolase [Acinetobacter sp.]|nr:serine hydrolase [Acinetobacter sp.]